MTTQMPAITRDRFDAVLFDLDGVLTSTAAIHAAAWKKMFDQFLATRNAGAFDINTDYKRYVDGKPRFDGVKSFLESRNIHLPWGDPAEPPNDRTICSLGNRKDAMVKDAIAAGQVQSFEGSVKWVRQLKHQGFKLAVVSSSQNCAQVLRAAKIDQYFDARVDGQTLIDQNIPGKPSPDSFLKAAQLLNVEPHRAIVVEDAISGVQAARAGHFGLIIGVDREGHPNALLQHGAHFIVNDLADLVSTNN